jgi:hypothetical protein
MEVTAILRELQEYYNKELTSVQARIYLRKMKEWEVKWVQLAAEHWIEDKGWFPRVHEFKEYYKKAPERKAQEIMDNPRRTAWKVNSVRRAVMKGDLPASALNKYPGMDSRPDVHQEEPLGEWWKEIEGKEYDGFPPGETPIIKERDWWKER